MPVLLLSFLAFGPRESRAQQGTGSIMGKVTDSTGAVIPGAAITITNQATLGGTTLASGDDGSFSSPPLPAGTYTVEAEKNGFRSASQQNYELNVDQRAELNFVLKTGDVSQSVDVQATSPALNTFNAALGSVIDNATAESLPSNGHNALALAQLDPGVVSTTGPVNEGFNDRGLGVSAIRIGGGISGGNANLLDGANNIQTTRGEISINGGISAMQ
jgi:hypothetical protein